MRARTLVILLAAVAGLADAQNPARPLAADSSSANRAALEAQVRQRIAELTKQRLNATDDQMAKLQETNRKFDDQRRALVDQERETRVALRQAMTRGDASAQSQIPALLDRVNALQRQRIDIQAAEQKELGSYLTPMQRAQYFALEQQVRQRVTQMRQAQIQNGGARLGRGGQVRPLGGRGRAGQPPIKPE